MPDKRIIAIVAAALSVVAWILYVAANATPSWQVLCFILRQVCASNKREWYLEYNILGTRAQIIIYILTSFLK